MGIKDFFQKAFSDMKASTKAQHEVDKARIKAAKGNNEYAETARHHEVSRYFVFFEVWL